MSSFLLFEIHLWNILYKWYINLNYELWIHLNIVHFYYSMFEIQIWNANSNSSPKP
jgi:hypothetical protein